MAQENLRYRISADSSGFVKETNRAAVATQKLNKSTRNSGQAFTQLAYALDDAQYGFRGVQNNIQAIAVSAGLGGPMILAITAATVAVGYFIDKWQDAGKKADNAITKIQDKLTQLRKDLGIATEENSIQALVSEYNKVLAPLKAELADLESRHGTIKTGPGGGVKVDLSEQIKKVQGKIRAQEKLLARDLQRIRDKASAERNKLDQEARDRRHKKEQQDEKKNAKEVAKIRVGYTHGHLAGDYRNIIGTGVGGNELPGNVNPETGSIFNVENFINQAKTDLKNAQNAIEPSVMELGDALQATLTNAFVGVGQAIGEGFANGFSGDEAFKVLGTFMQSLGSAIIAIGVAELALKYSFKNPWAAIAAGTALVAAGSALSAARSQNPAGSGGGTGSSARYTSPSAVPSQVQGTGGSADRVIGELELRGQNLVVALQAANETRNRF